MAKMTDWTIRFSGEARDAFVQMMQEIPLLCYEMTPEELDYAFRRGRQQAWARQTRILMMVAIMIVVIDLLLLFSFVLINPAVIKNSFGFLGGTTFFLTSFFFLLSYWQVRRVEKKPEVLVTYSGAFFLGSFYPFRISYTYLSAASFVEGDGGEPPSLRLNFTPIGTLKSGAKFDANLGKSDYLIEIPLRVEHVGKINEIIKILVPDLEEGEVVIKAESPLSQVAVSSKLIELYMTKEELRYALRQYNKAYLIAFVRTIPEIVIITGGLIWFLISMIKGNHVSVYMIFAIGTCLLGFGSIAILKPFLYFLRIDRTENQIILNSDSFSFLAEIRYYRKKWSYLKSASYDPNAHPDFGILTLKFAPLHSWNVHTGTDAATYEIPIRNEFRNQMDSIMAVISPKDPFDTK